MSGALIGGEQGRTAPVVLIVDDDPLIRTVIEAALEWVGSFEVWSACDGATGLEMVDAVRPDFVFLDLMIPGKSGFAVLEALQRRGPSIDGMRVIVTSGLVGPGVVERLTDLGSPEILPKPFRLNELKGLIEGGRSNE